MANQGNKTYASIGVCRGTTCGRGCCEGGGLTCKVLIRLLCISASLPLCSPLPHLCQYVFKADP